ncbi:unnamed protein product [Symbiodinium natans]|uniref:Uncharacterized protein n=1 Tax=Symbiodinium natans TaxID=878477 RepID=A0A812K5G7_9DINO|nr:unnamed protein product [Symbiodinium natans]
MAFFGFDTVKTERGTKRTHEDETPAERAEQEKIRRAILAGSERRAAAAKSTPRPQAVPVQAPVPKKREEWPKLPPFVLNGEVPRGEKKQVCNTYNLATSQPQAVVMQRHTFLLAILTHDIKVSVCRTEDRQPA